MIRFCGFVRKIVSTFVLRLTFADRHLNSSLSSSSKTTSSYCIHHSLTQSNSRDLASTICMFNFFKLGCFSFVIPKTCSMRTQYELKYRLKSFVESVEFFVNGVINVLVSLYVESAAINCGSDMQAEGLLANNNY